MIHASLKRCKLQDYIGSILTQAGYFVSRSDDKLNPTTFAHSDIIIGPALYESMSTKEKDVIARLELVSDKEQEQLLNRVNKLCTKEAIISQATNMDYTPLKVPGQQSQ